MKKSLSFLIVGLVVFTCAMFAADEVKELEVKIGGRVYQDWGWFSGDEDALAAFGYDSGTEYRTARFSAEATFWGHVKGKAEMDWSSGVIVFKDVYMELMNLPFNITVGHFKEPFSLEELTSSRFVTFMERASINNLVPSRNSGIQLSANLADKMIYIAVGAFKEVGDVPTNLVVNDGDDVWAITARLAASPVYNEETNTVVHIGIAFSSRDLGDNGTLHLRARPETHIGNRLIDTYTFDATGSTLFGLEAAGVFGPFSVQGEYLSDAVDSPDYGDPVLTGYYIEGSFWLTPGDHRTYKRSAAAFDRPKVKNLFLLQDGFGALQLAARYSNLNLNGGLIEGGKMNDFTIGLNWYPVDNARIMLNYIISDTDKFGSFTAFEVRFQYDWESKYSK
jgi:phosphate-selective porin OprO/OprP